ncbi:MAG: endonuclease IV [Methanomassiliicoccales archaeon PtaB.Bin134]|jgi:deoxyribonuclease-4|nr:MAG: endonuclease IV [Methanomassiliicoccales archaeon PtaB.Bin134]
MIRVGPAGYPEGSRSPADGVRKVRQAGLDALELQFVRNVQFNPQKAHEAREEAERLDVLLSAHAPYYINLASPSPETREKSMEWVIRAMRGAEAFGAWLVVVHAATYGRLGKEEATRQVIAAFHEVSDRARGEGLNALIGLETMGRGAAWGTLEEIARVMAEVPGTVPVVDFAHLRARGTDLDPASLRSMLASVPEVPRLHCHISGIEFTAAGERRHLRLGEGLDHLMVLDALVDRGMEATVICESTAPMEDSRRMLEHLTGSCRSI